MLKFRTKLTVFMFKYSWKLMLFRKNIFLLLNWIWSLILKSAINFIFNEQLLKLDGNYQRDFYEFKNKQFIILRKSMIPNGWNKN